MQPKHVAINKLIILLEIADALEGHPSLDKITNSDGMLVIPIERYDDFCHDFGLIIGRILEKLCEPYDENKLTDE